MAHLRYVVTLYCVRSGVTFIGQARRSKLRAFHNALFHSPPDMLTTRDAERCNELYAIAAKGMAYHKGVPRISVTDDAKNVTVQIERV